MAESKEDHGIPPPFLAAFHEMLAVTKSEWWKQMEAALEPFGLKPESSGEQRRLYVNTSTFLCAMWLHNHTAPEFLTEWPGTDRKTGPVGTVFSLSVNIPPKQPAGPIPIKAIIHGYLVATSEEKQGPPPVKFDLEKIGEIELIPLAPNRSEVVITSWLKESQEFIDWLLEEIVDRWPEARTQKTTRIHGARAEAIDRVQEAIELEKTEELSMTEACKRAHCSTETYHKYKWRFLTDWKESNEDWEDSSSRIANSEY